MRSPRWRAWTSAGEPHPSPSRGRARTCASSGRNWASRLCWRAASGRPAVRSEFRAAHPHLGWFPPLVKDVRSGSGQRSRGAGGDCPECRRGAQGEAAARARGRRPGSESLRSRGLQQVPARPGGSDGSSSSSVDSPASSRRAGPGKATAPEETLRGRLRSLRDRLAAVPL